MSESKIIVRRLDPQDDRKQFESDNIDLNRFFVKYAGKNQFKHYIGTTYVAIEGDNILGYITVSASQISVDEMSKGLLKKLPLYPLPVLRVARLAVDKRHTGKGVGVALLKSMFELAVEIRDKIGCVGVLVDAKPEAKEYYLKLGFMEIEVIKGASNEKPKPVAMFLSIKMIIAAMNE